VADLALGSRQRCYAAWPGSLFGVAIAVPNPPSHRRAHRLHDLHHVVTGYGTDHAGEAEISAWQLRRGARAAGHYVGAIVVANALLGLALAPGRTLTALRGVAGSSLFQLDLEYEALLDRSVGELRALLGIRADGLAVATRGLHARAPDPAGATG
jgi:hypothetical protein